MLDGPQLRFQSYETDDPKEVIEQAARRYAEDIENRIEECESYGQHEAASYMKSELSELKDALGTLHPSAAWDKTL